MMVSSLPGSPGEVYTTHARSVHVVSLANCRGESPGNGSPHEISSLSCDIQLYSYCMTKHSLQANVFMHVCMHLTCIKEIATSLLCSHFAFYDENEKVVPMTSQAVSKHCLYTVMDVFSVSMCTSSWWVIRSYAVVLFPDSHS